eukprot:TRINITY_DN7488_c0_g1_i1.p1 TRINITY_DN7488_c0_g1~~TRINITY_DN7488_c0_g1_i1.p1  ORF type:complete len:101 (-),score=15.61 TRINITY_DN7488_c0_g1_i1:213-515(-)
MPAHPQSAVYDDYLESQLRPLLEELVEAVLTGKPDDVDKFALDWLVAWHRINGEDELELQQLRARHLRKRLEAREVKCDEGSLRDHDQQCWVTTLSTFRR